MRQRPPRLRVGRPAAPRLDVSHERDRGTTHERGYGWQWQQLRQIVLNDEPLCRRCSSRNRVSGAVLVDHIVPLLDGGTHDRSNLQSLCFDCHAVKTQADVRARRRRGARKTGGVA
jgi:5-methylcytosine-specific restriction protein A